MIDRLLRLLSDTGTQFGHVDARLLIAALMFHVANHGLRSLAWRNVIAGAYREQRVPYLPVVTAYALGVALNAALPGRGGDAAKLALVRRRLPGSSVMTIASTMAVIMLFDLVAATVLVAGICLTGAIPFAPQVPLAGLPGALAAHLPVTLGAALALGGAGFLVARRLGAPLARLLARVRQGGAILREPSRYLRHVALVQAAAWASRIMVVYLLLQAFSLPASIPTAALVMVLCGASTLVPLTPGGAGTQQVMLTYALGRTAGAAVVLSFSVGMQAGITLVNAVLGIAAGMVAFRTVHPIAAVRASLRLARGATAG